MPALSHVKILAARCFLTLVPLRKITTHPTTAWLHESEKPVFAMGRGVQKR